VAVAIVEDLHTVVQELAFNLHAASVAGAEDQAGRASPPLRAPPAARQKRGKPAGFAGQNCIPIGCHDAICDLDYCGKIGDGCGGALDCGMACRVGQLCNTARGMCMGDASCLPLTCDNGTPGNYCGDIGDGCLGVLHCPTDCNLAGWTCENHICVVRPPAGEFLTCATPAERWCGKIADGCGGILDCGLQCPQPGWLCSLDGRCVGGKDCVPVSCDGPAGERYCGTIGDGCGGRLECTRACSGSGLSCRDNLCVETAGCPKDRLANHTRRSAVTVLSRLWRAGQS